MGDVQISMMPHRGPLEFGCDRRDCGEVRGFTICWRTPNLSGDFVSNPTHDACWPTSAASCIFACPGASRHEALIHQRRPKTAVCANCVNRIASLHECVRFLYQSWVIRWLAGRNQADSNLQLTVHVGGGALRAEFALAEQAGKYQFAEPRVLAILSMSWARNDERNAAQFQRLAVFSDSVRIAKTS